MHVQLKIHLPTNIQLHHCHAKFGATSREFGLMENLTSLNNKPNSMNTNQRNATAITQLRHSNFNAMVVAL